MQRNFHPLNEAQKGIYFDYLQHPESTAYNVSFKIDLPKRVDIEKFRNAVIKSTKNHPGLFVKIDAQNGEPAMIPCDFDCDVLLTHGNTNEATNNFVRPFRLEDGPLFRFEICTDGENSVFLFDIHHIVFDGTSVRIFLDEIISCYNDKEITSDKGELLNFAADEKSMQSTEQYSKAVKFYDNILSGRDFTSGLIPDADGTLLGSERLTYTSPKKVNSTNVYQYTKSLGLTQATLFTAAFAYALSIFGGTDEVCFSTVSSGRHAYSLPSCAGMFVKTLPLCVDIDGQKNINEFLTEFHKSYHEAIRNEVISFGELATKYNANIDISFIYQGSMLSDFCIEGENTMPVQLPQDCQSDILCMILKTTDGYMMRIQYNRAKFTSQYINSLSSTIFEIAYGMISEEKLCDIPLATKETLEFIDKFNSTEKQYNEGETVNVLLEKSLTDNANRTAVISDGKSYTYADLDVKTNKIATYISSLGLASEDFVTVLTPRNADGVFAAWGVIRAGCAIQMLDPTYPPERLKFMLADSGAKLLIADRTLISLIDSFNGNVLFTDTIDSLATNEIHINPNPNSAIAVIYTSGTTGNPKGAILENRNLVAFYHNHIAKMGIDDTSRVATYASFGFDAGIMDIIATILAGACLCIVPEDIRLDLTAIEKFYIANSITHGFMTTQVGRMFAEKTKCKTLKAFLVGGEKLVPFSVQDGFDFINGYGPCETMGYVCSSVVKDDLSCRTIGTPSDNTKLYVIDKYNRLMPVGAVGELAISGFQVGRGYLNLPDKTAEVFIPNPFCEMNGYEMLYRSGDILRLLPCGELDFVGRRDGQVKIRGFRVELTEIEEVIREFDGITDATVTTFDDPVGGKFIAAYITGDSDIDALRGFIGMKKPQYMIPRTITRLEAIPYNHNMKVDKRALPVPVLTATDTEKPSTNTQKVLFDIASEILGTDCFGINSDLFDLGLTSVGLLGFTSSLYEKIGVSLGIADIKRHGTIKQIAQLCEKRTNNSANSRAEYRELKPNEMGILLDCRKTPDSTVYNIPVLLKISENIDIEKLCRVIRQSADIHPHIKSTIKADKDGNMLFVNNETKSIDVSVIQIDKLPDVAELIRPFNLDGNLYRIEIYVTNDGNYLLVDIHHIISDGTSEAIFFRDINRLYGGEILNEEKYSDFDKNKLIADEELVSEGEKYYENLLSNADVDCPIPFSPECDDDSCGTLCRRFGDKSESITEFCRVNKVTQNAFFNAVFGFVLTKFAHRDTATYCTIYNGRNNPDVADAFGCFVRTIPAVFTIPENSTAEKLVENMQNQLLDTFAYDMVAFSDLASKYDVRPDIFLNYQGEGFSFDNIGGEKAEELPTDVLPAKAPLSLEIFLNNGEYTVTVNYRRSCYSKALVCSVTEALLLAAEGFAKRISLDKISLLSDIDKAEIDKMNDTEKAFEPIPSYRIFEKIAKEKSDAVAVRTLDSSLTFGELNKTADAIAENLLNLGVHPGEIIGLILNRSVLVPAAEIGIMKAGCAFLPILPSYPYDRTAYCLNDAGCHIVITERAIIDSKKASFGNGIESVAIEDLLASKGNFKNDIEDDLSSLAYCIYTSGSSGTPKGVMLEHKNLTNFVQTAGLCDTVAKGSTIVAMASISFDMSITEIFFCLCNGKTVYIASEDEVHNTVSLFEAMTKYSVDIAMMTPTFAWNLLSMPESEKVFSNINAVVLGAEAFRPGLFDRLKACNPDMLIQNGYGPTECTQVCSVKTLSDGKHITIGKPFPNTKFYVLDIHGNILPRFASGELLICGEGVCRGYVNLPEKNMAAFCEIEGIKAYHSGDLVKINGDNEIEFCGRTDNQIKLRGFRIETDEIENAILEFSSVKTCKVIVRNNGSEDYLCGFFTASEKVEIKDLTAFLKTRLTYYMVPAVMMQLDEMPLTSNGKIDVKSFPDTVLSIEKTDGRPAKTKLEKRICEVFAEVLSLEKIYADDNFFELGGTSISASRVTMLLMSDGLDVSYGDIFDNPTPEALANRLDSEKPAKTEIVDSSELDTTRDALKYNTVKYSPEVERKSLGNVLLTGATGFLGIHILRELIDIEEGHIYCLVRKGSFSSPKDRLKAMLFYYFSDGFDEVFSSRITVINADITDSGLENILADVPFDTLINSAACVKHFADGDIIERINVGGVENLISICKKYDKKLIQISTTSVPGIHTAESYERQVKMHENELFVIDDMDNKYAISKYHAELRMFDAIEDGMRGKVLRAGNLMGRHSDGEFQVNMDSNMFLSGIRGFAAMGKYPISHMTDPMRFSPVDCTARAMVLLAGVNDKFTAFNCDNRYGFDEMKIIDACNRNGIKISAEQDDVYYSEYREKLGDETINSKLNGLAAYDIPDAHSVDTDNRFTANILYRIGFSWPLTDDAYLDRVIKSIKTLDYFEDTQ